MGHGDIGLRSRHPERDKLIFSLDQKLKINIFYFIYDAFWILIMPNLQHRLQVTAIILASGCILHSQTPDPDWTRLMDAVQQQEDSGDPAAALESGKMALAAAEAHPGPGEKYLIQTLRVVGRLYFNRRRFDQAEVHFERAHRLMLDQEEPDSLTLARVQVALGRVYLELDRAPLAVLSLEEALQILTEVRGEGDPEGVAVLRRLISIHQEHHAYDRAAEALTRLWTIARNQHGDNSLEVAEGYLNLADNANRAGAIPAAEAYLAWALAIEEKVLGTDHERVGSTRGFLVDIMMMEGKYAQAVPVFGTKNPERMNMALWKEMVRLPFKQPEKAYVK